MCMNLQGLAAQIRSIRLERGLTQEQLAELSGLSAHYIGNLEQAVRRPSLNAIFQICHGLGATPNQLLKDSISEEMLSGLSVPVNDLNTLRQTISTLADALSDVLLLEDEESPSLFGVPAYLVTRAEPEPEFESLTDHPIFDLLDSTDE